MAILMTRTPDINKELPWNLEAVYPTEQHWHDDIGRVRELLPTIAAFQGHLAQDGATLLSCLQLQDQIEEIAERVEWYAYNKAAENRRDPDRQALHATSGALQSELRAATAFIRPEILRLPPDMVERFVTEEPRLAMYEHYLNVVLSAREHQLCEEAERVLGSMDELAKSPQTVWVAITSSIRLEPISGVDGERIDLDRTSARALLMSPDRRLRANAYERLRAGYAAHSQALAATVATAVRRDVMIARLRGYPSSLTAALAEDHLPESLYHSLLAASEAHSHVLRRFHALRRELLGVDVLMPWDMRAPLCTAPVASLTFDEGFDLVIKALAPLGTAYVDILQQARRERWIHWSAQPGKRPGAYSYSTKGARPVLMLTWRNRLEDAFVLAHELGHTAHSVLSEREQPFRYAACSAFLAEIASTTNEMMLAMYLSKRHLGQSGSTLSGLGPALESLIRRYYHASMDAALQLKMHQMVESGEPLTGDSITRANAEILRRWHGTAVEVEALASEWLQEPHHLQGYYAYQYVTSFESAARVADSILSEGGPAVQRYLAFLAAGSSAYPTDLLKRAGVLMEPEGFCQAPRLFEQLLSDLADPLPRARVGAGAS